MDIPDRRFMDPKEELIRLPVMDFGDVYYKRLMTLLQSDDSSVVDDLWKVVDEVAAFYQREGVTEYWVSPAEEELNPQQGAVRKQEKSLLGPRKEKSDEAVAVAAQRLLPSEAQFKAVPAADNESSNSFDLSKRKQPAKLTIPGVPVKKSLGDDLLPTTGRIGQEGIACVVCRKLGFTSGNSVIECQECHDMYHQKCHTPNIPQNQVDPRYVWYCSKCSKLMRKIAAKALATAASSSSPQEKLSGIGKSAPSRKSPSADNPLGKMFSRFEATGAFGYSTSTTASTPKPLPAISDLAADFFAKYRAKSKNQAKLCASSMKASAANEQAPSSSSTISGPNGSSAEKASTKSLLSSTNNSARPTPAVASSQIQAAEKRLLQMKKKAAMKTAYNKMLP
uniref:Integrator complex subunit 12 n=1 Tax=Trichuris muris TaxID=70415 RepID=A0A5S6QK74_TRIMR